MGGDRCRSTSWFTAELGAPPVQASVGLPRRFAISGCTSLIHIGVCGSIGQCMTPQCSVLASVGTSVPLPLMRHPGPLQTLSPGRRNSFLYHCSSQLLFALWHNGSRGGWLRGVDCPPTIDALLCSLWIPFPSFDFGKRVFIIFQTGFSLEN